MSEQHEFVQKMDSYEMVADGIVFHCTTSQRNSVDTQFTVCSPHVLRFQMCADQELKNVKGLLEIYEDWPASAFDVSETPETVAIDTGAVRLEVQKEPWCYTIYDKAGEVVLKENIRDLDAHSNYRTFPIGFMTEDGKSCRSNETFNLHPGESFFGFGEKFTRLNKLGQRIHGWNKNPFGGGTEEAYKNIPFFMCTRGYGIFVNSTYRITYDVGSLSLASVAVVIDDPRLDLFIIYGPNLKDVLARYDEITGWPSLPPKESFGIWHTPQTPEGTLEDVVAGAQKFRDLDIPIDLVSNIIIMATRQGVTSNELQQWTKDLSKELAPMGIKPGLYVYPLLNIGSELEKEARNHGYAVTRKDGTPYEICLGVKNEGEQGESEYSMSILERDDAWRERHNRIFYTPCLMPDFTNPNAVKWWKSKIVEFMKAGCFAVLMSDFGEDVPPDACFFNGRSGLEVHNIYTLLYQKATFEAVAEGTGHRGLVNARSGTAGLQRYPICWSGDPNCEWEDFLTDMRAGLSIGLSGVPFWSCDNAGFSGTVGHLTPELWTRWSQWTMFQSHVRLHGTSQPRVPWDFGNKAVSNFRKYAKLRYRLLPYTYSQAYNTTKTGLPMMRAMVLEFQDDPNTHDMDDQYLFGEAFLVAPVYTPINKRSVYLPEGTWFDYWTGKEYEGPTLLHIEPPLEVLPLYVRGDSIIPMGPDMAYVGEKPFDPLTLDIWLDSVADLKMYDDDEKVRCRARRKKDKIIVDISASKKTYVVKLNKTGCPTKVCLNGIGMPRVSSWEEANRAERGWYFDTSFEVYVKGHTKGTRSRLVIEA